MWWRFDSTIYDSVYFDVSITEICGWVYNGGAVVCRDLNSNTWFDDIREVLYKYNITHVAACPSVFLTMMNIYSNEINIFNNLKFVYLRVNDLV